MSVCLIARGDGRDEYERRSWASLREMLPPVAHTVIVDDRDHALGFGGAVREGWGRALTTECTHFLDVELDFIYRRSIELAAMVRVLDVHPYLVQIALLRGPVNDVERAAGGIIEQHPVSYTTREWNGHSWREHKRFVTTNASLWPRWVLERGWPDVPRSEGMFGIELFASDPALRAAYWGTSVDIEHIGHVRSGRGY